MDNHLEAEMTAAVSAAISGKVDALAAALFGILELSRSIPELSAAIEKNMALRHAAHLAEPEDPMYIQGFENERAKILKILR